MQSKNIPVLVFALDDSVERDDKNCNEDIKIATFMTEPEDINIENI